MEISQKCRVKRSVSFWMRDSIVILMFTFGIRSNQGRVNETSDFETQNFIPTTLLSCQVLSQDSGKYHLYLCAMSRNAKNIPQIWDVFHMNDYFTHMNVAQPKLNIWY